VRRREKSLSFKLPAKLAKHNPDDWEGRDSAEKYGEWMDARREWKDARDIIILPDDAAASAAFPDGVFYPEDI
jgi:hypothetical protein